MSNLMACEYDYIPHDCDHSLARAAWKKVGTLERRLDRLGRAYLAAYNLPSPRDWQRMQAIEEAQMRVGSMLRAESRKAQALETSEIWPNGLPAHP